MRWAIVHTKPTSCKPRFEIEIFNQSKDLKEQLLFCAKNSYATRRFVDCENAIDRHRQLTEILDENVVLLRCSDVNPHGISIVISFQFLSA